VITREHHTSELLVSHVNCASIKEPLMLSVSNESDRIVQIAGGGVGGGLVLIRNHPRDKKYPEADHNYNYYIHQ
jgi:hypothetical protein